MLKVDFEIAHIYHLNRFLRFLRKIFPQRRLKHLINWLKIKTLLLARQKKVITLSFSTEVTMISKQSNILEDTSEFKRVNIEEGKTLNYLIHLKE